MVESFSNPKLEDLKEIQLLRSLSEAELQNLLSFGKLENHEAHTNIIVEGEPSWGIYLILGGLISVLKANRSTNDTIEVAQLRPGSYFGEMSLIDENPRSATIKALTDSTVFHIPKAALEAMIEKSSDLRNRFYQSCIKNLVQRVRDLDENYVVSQYQLWKVALKQEKAS